LSGTSLVGDRRRGFLDLVLLTPLEPRQVLDGTFLAIWQHLRRIYWLPITLGVFFGLAGSSRFGAILFSLVTALLFAALLVVHGTACSLTAKTGAGALGATFAFPLFMIAGAPFLIPIFRGGLGPGLWLLSALFFAASWFWVRKRLTVAALCSYFLAMHLALTSLATCWTWGDPLAKEYPVAAINPGFLTIDPLVWRPRADTIGVNRMARPRYRPNPDVLYPCYWTALLVNLVWARWWLIRKFECLVERTGAGRVGQPRRLDVSG